MREVSRSIDRCELTHLARSPIDVGRARAQHDAYVQALAELGCRIDRLVEDPARPDSVFIEDTAVVLDEVAVITRPGAVSRQGETAEVAEALRPYRELRRLEAPATLDGGDVLRVGRAVFVGMSGRSNDDALLQLRQVAGHFGYTVIPVAVRGCLHLKSAVTQVGPETLLTNGAWLPGNPFAGFERIEVDPREPFAANGLLVGDTLVYPAAFPATGDRLTRRGILTRTVDVTELAKAEGAVTCCSLVFTV